MGDIRGEYGRLLHWSIFLLHHGCHILALSLKNKKHIFKNLDYLIYFEIIVHSFIKIFLLVKYLCYFSSLYYFLQNKHCHSCKFEVTQFLQQEKYLVLDFVCGVQFILHSRSFLLSFNNPVNHYLLLVLQCNAFLILQIICKFSIRDNDFALYNTVW